MMGREVTNINVGLDPDGHVLLQFQHNDATSYTTRMARNVCVMLISALEKLHGEAMAQAAGVPIDRITLHEDITMEID